MAAKPLIYLLLSDNGKLLAAASTGDDMLSALNKAIRDGSAFYVRNGDPRDYYEIPEEDQQEMLEQDWPVLTREKLNNNLIHGYLDTVYSGELYAEP